MRPIPIQKAMKTLTTMTPTTSQLAVIMIQTAQVTSSKYLLGTLAVLQHYYLTICNK